MADSFKLLYRGAVRADQHAAVVAGRLQKLLKTSSEQAQVLMSGKPVVVQRAADAKTAKRYRDAFAAAGAVLEVQALDDTTEVTETPNAQDNAASSPVSAPDAARDSAGGFTLAAPGEVLLRENERAPDEEPAVELVPGQFSLAFPGEDLNGTVELVDVPEAPSTAHLQLDAVGASLSEVTQEIAPPDLSLDFELADAGAPLLDDAPQDLPVAAPDVSHLVLAERT